MSHTITKITLVAISLAFAGVASAVPISLTQRCSETQATNGIGVGDVTGNMGGATDCWGTFDGNDEGPSGDGYAFGGQTFNFLAKENTPGALEGANIGLSVTPSGGALSGDWAFTPGSVLGDFLIVLKAASKPGYAVWLFRGADAASWMGTWSVAWGKDLSHLSIYSTGDGPPPPPPPPPSNVPEPGTLGLLGLGLVGIGLARRRKKV